MAKVDFKGPYLKVERAEHHICKLETIFGHYVSNNAKRLRPQNQSRLLKQARAAIPRGFPEHTPTILGDAIHNLRASLDHAYCIMVEANGRTVGNFTRFPFAQNRQSLEATIKGQKLEGLTPSDRVLTTIVDDIQPYEGGKLGLYGLHRLDITDKHHILIPTLSEMRIKGLDFVTGGYIRDVTFITNNNCQVFDDPMKGILHGNPKDTFVVVFGKGQPFEGKGILDTMRDLKMKVIDALTFLENAA